MSGISVFFDTNVLVYAHDELSPFHEKSALLLDLSLTREITGIISEQNLMELYRILTNASAMSGKPLSPSEAKALILETYLSGEIKLVYPSSDTLIKTLEIVSQRRLTSARIFDVRLYVQALQTRPDYFLTYNKSDFENLGDIPVKTPDEIV
ncbi:MAG: PIN domain-containing protein [Nitrospirae bacterium]|nr:PIN domain-containing protein [Nitrospirota bacterium]MBF0536151.1 PIN domain-containing protein [Nitrospirota bacterium]